MEKFNNFSRDEEEYSCALANSDLKIFSGPPPKRVTKLSEQELKPDQLVEQRHSETDPRNNKLECINLSKLVMHSGNFRENFFSDSATINFSTSF